MNSNERRVGMVAQFLRLAELSGASSARAHLRSSLQLWMVSCFLLGLLVRQFGGGSRRCDLHATRFWVFEPAAVKEG